MRKVLALTVGLLCAVAAIAACGGISKASGSSSGNGTGSSAFNDLLTKSKSASIRVTYTTLDNSGNVTETWTISQDGADKVAYITKDGDSKIVTVNGTTTSCDNLNTSPDCTTLPGSVGADATTGLTALYTAATSGLAAAAAANGLGKQTDDTVAGRSATCVTLTLGGALGNAGKAIAKAVGSNTNAGYQTCIDKQTGFLLKYVVVGIDNDKSGIVATEVGQPQDSDFTVPSTTTTTGGSSDTSAGPSGSTAPSGGSATTQPCTSNTLPGGSTIPGGNTIPCISPG